MAKKISSRKIIVPSFILIFILMIGLTSYFFSKLSFVFKERQQKEIFHHLLSLADVYSEELLLKVNSNWQTVDSTVVFCENNDKADLYDLKIFLLSKKYEWEVEDIALYTETGSVYDEFGTKIEKNETVKRLGILPVTKHLYTFENGLLNYVRHVKSSITINGEKLVAVSTSKSIESLFEELSNKYFEDDAYYCIINNSGKLLVDPINPKFSYPEDIASFVENNDMKIFGENGISLKESLQKSLIFSGTFYNTFDDKTHYIITIPMTSRVKYEPTKGHFGIIIPEDIIAKNYTDYSKYVTRISTILIVFVSLLMLFVFLLAYKNKSRIIQNTLVETEKSQNEKLKMALSMAEQSNNAKTSFLSNMSHDIRTPLNAIISMTDFALQEKDVPKKVSYYLDIIRNSSNHLMRLINNVLDMTRIESGKLIIKQEPFNMAVLLSDVTNIVRTDCNKKKITLYTETSSVEHTHLVGDKLNIQRILINLLSNAVKFTPEYGSIWFTIEENKSLRAETCSLRFVVEDTGFGIKKENLDSIFKPFVRENTSKTTNVEGTGLGLAITKNLIETMGGSISVESVENQGTKFCVDLFFPISSEKNVYQQPDYDKKDKAAYDFGGIKALVVEDNIINRQIIGVLLQNINIKYDFAENGKVALEKIANSPSNSYDLIYMDIQMPELNGYETTETLRKGEKEEYHTIPIIAMTANVFDEDVEKCRKSGMNAHIGKPIDPSQLAYVTNQVLSNKNVDIFSEIVGGGGTSFLSEISLK